MIASLVNSRGQVLRTAGIGAGSRAAAFDASGLSSGMYRVLVDSEKKRIGHSLAVIR
jgi:hypothetical protein